MRGTRTRNEGQIEGVDPSNPPVLPESSGKMQSGIGAELSDDSPYAKSHAERTLSEQESSQEKV